MSNADRLWKGFTRDDKREAQISPGSPTAASRANAWVEFTSAEYDEMKPKWEFVDDHYTGSVLDDDKIGLYLFQRAQSESDDDFNERKKIASQPYHLAFIFDTFAGLAATADRNAKLILNDPDSPETGLGDPEERGSFAHSIETNIDGKGTNWKPFWQSFTTAILRFNLVYIVANGVVEETYTDEEGELQSREIAPPHLRILSPTQVTNVFYEGTRLTGAVVKHIVDGRESIEDAPVQRTRYTVYRLEGSDTYEVRTDGNGKKTIHLLPELSVDYEYWNSQDQDYRVLPIFPVRLAFDRYLAYQAARRINSVFNMESERDAAVRKGNLARLVLIGSTNFFSEIKDWIIKGFNALRQDPKQTRDHYYLNPPTEPAKLAGEIIKDRLEDFLFTTFREYANSAKQKTATEINQDRRAGLEALLIILLDAMTEAQNGALFRLEQAYLPNNPDTWGTARIIRDPDFQHISNREIIEKMIDLFYPGKPIPVGNEGLISVAKRIADYFGVEYEESELTSAVESDSSQSAQTGAALAEFGL